MAVSESTRAPNRPSQFVAAFMALAGLVLSCGAIVLLIHHDDPPQPKFTSAEDVQSSGDPAIFLGEMFIEGTLEVAAGATIPVANIGAVPHNLSVENGPKTPDINAGKAFELDLSTLAPGTYTVFCAIPGHRGGGMEAQLVITS
jgi:plastocyanin